MTGMVSLPDYTRTRGTSELGVELYLLSIPSPRIIASYDAFLLLCIKMDISKYSLKNI
jgi:hypothetical protein